MTVNEALSRSRTERSRLDATKSGGVHYTPPELALFVAANALAAVTPRTKLRVLDPACGDGALLAAIVEITPEGCDVQVVGCDKDARALDAADRRLRELQHPGLSWTLEECDFLSQAVQLRGDTESLFGGDVVEALQKPFDIVIANPPYVRTQVLGAEEAQRLARVFGLAGRVDLYHAFAVAMTESLRPEGALALLCSNRFMTTRGGSSLRRHLATRMNLEHVFDLGDTKLFEAAVLPAVVVATRRAPNGVEPEMASVYECPIVEISKETPSVLVALSERTIGPISVNGTGFDVRRGILRLEDKRDAPWVLSAAADDWVAKVDERLAMRFGDLGRIRVGIKTTADKVFVREDWDSLGQLTPEPDLLLSLLTHHAARRWDADEPAFRVLYPYDLTQRKRVPLDLDQWPRAAAYFDTHRERLAGRQYVVEAGRNWWEIWVPQRPSEWALPKLVFPDISEQPRFSLDYSGAVVNGDCYWLALPTEESYGLGLLAMAVANSSLGTRYYDSVCGNKLYSGRRRYITQYVERFPIPDPSTPEAAKIRDLVNVLVAGGTSPGDVAGLEGEIDELVWRSFGFEEIPG